MHRDAQTGKRNSQTQNVPNGGQIAEHPSAQPLPASLDPTLSDQPAFFARDALAGLPLTIDQIIRELYAPKYISGVDIGALADSVDDYENWIVDVAAATMSPHMADNSNAADRLVARLRDYFDIETPTLQQQLYFFDILKHVSRQPDYVVLGLLRNIAVSTYYGSLPHDLRARALSSLYTASANPAVAQALNDDTVFMQALQTDTMTAGPSTHRVVETDVLQRILGWVQLDQLVTSIRDASSGRFVNDPNQPMKDLQDALHNVKLWLNDLLHDEDAYGIFLSGLLTRTLPLIALPTPPLEPHSASHHKGDRPAFVRWLRAYQEAGAGIALVARAAMDDDPGAMETLARPLLIILKLWRVTSHVYAEIIEKGLRHPRVQRTLSVSVQSEKTPSSIRGLLDDLLKPPPPILYLPNSPSSPLPFGILSLSFATKFIEGLDLTPPILQSNVLVDVHSCLHTLNQTSVPHTHLPHASPLAECSRVDEVFPHELTRLFIPLVRLSYSILDELSISSVLARSSSTVQASAIEVLIQCIRLIRTLVLPTSSLRMTRVMKRDAVLLLLRGVVLFQPCSIGHERTERLLLHSIDLLVTLMASDKEKEGIEGKRTHGAESLVILLQLPFARTPVFTTSPSFLPSPIDVIELLTLAINHTSYIRANPTPDSGTSIPYLPSWSTILTSAFPELYSVVQRLPPRNRGSFIHLVHDADTARHGVAELLVLEGCRFLLAACDALHKESDTSVGDDRGITKILLRHLVYNELYVLKELVAEDWMISFLSQDEEVIAALVGAIGSLLDSKEGIMSAAYLGKELARVPNLILTVYSSFAAMMLRLARIPSSAASSELISTSSQLLSLSSTSIHSSQEISISLVVSNLAALLQSIIHKQTVEGVDIIYQFEDADSVLTVIEAIINWCIEHPSANSGLSFPISLSSLESIFPTTQIDWLKGIALDARIVFADHSDQIAKDDADLFTLFDPDAPFDGSWEEVEVALGLGGKDTVKRDEHHTEAGLEVEMSEVQETT